MAWEYYSKTALEKSLIKRKNNFRVIGYGVEAKLKNKVEFYIDILTPELGINPCN